MEKQNQTRVKTNAGRLISHFTLLVLFKPNGKYKNPRFTYRGDEKLSYFNSTKGTNFRHQYEALEYQAKMVMEKANEITLWDNSFDRPHNIYKKWVKGELVEDHSKEYFFNNEGVLCRRILNYVAPKNTRTQPYFEPTEDAKPNIFEKVVKQ